MFSRLTRRIDRIIPFDFVIEHMPGAKIGLADYLSRHPVGDATRISLYDNTFTVVKLQSITNSLGYINTTKGTIKASRRSIVQLRIYKLETIDLILRRKRASKRVTFGEPIRSQ